MRNLKITSLNVNGLKAYYYRDFMKDGTTAFDRTFEFFDPDILLIQETKCSSSDTEWWFSGMENHKVYAQHNTQKNGYSGVAIIIKNEFVNSIINIHRPEFQDEEYYFGGRIIAIEFENLIVVNVYTLNSGSEKNELRKKWDIEFLGFITELKTLNKSIVIGGDINVCHQPLDNHKYYEYFNSLPSLMEFEIEGMSSLLGSGFLDTFREFNPDVEKYSWFSWGTGAYERRKGYRVDYILVTPDLIGNVVSTGVHDDYKLSDHFPVSIELSGVLK